MNENFFDGFETEKLSIVKVDENNQVQASNIYTNLINFRKKTYGMRTPRFKKVLNKKCLPPKKNADCFNLYLINNQQTDKAMGLLALYHKWPNDHTLFIGIFYIDEDYKKRGYGTEILNTLCEHVKPFYENLMIRVHKINQYKPEFFFKNGFTYYNSLPKWDAMMIKKL